MADEARSREIREHDPEGRRTVRDAQETLPEFRALLRLPGEANALVCVRTRLTVGTVSALVWLLVIKATREGFVASVFEVPPELNGLMIGDRFDVASGEVADWMYNMDGILHGGFSLREQRARLSVEEQAWFDERIGVTQYV